MKIKIYSSTSHLKQWKTVILTKMKNEDWLYRQLFPMLREQLGRSQDRTGQSFGIAKRKLLFWKLSECRDWSASHMFQIVIGNVSYCKDEMGIFFSCPDGNCSRDKYVGNEPLRGNARKDVFLKSDLPSGKDESSSLHSVLGSVCIFWVKALAVKRKSECKIWARKGLCLFCHLLPLTGLTFWFFSLSSDIRSW